MGSCVGKNKRGVREKAEATDSGVSSPAMPPIGVGPGKAAGEAEALALVATEKLLLAGDPAHPDYQGLKQTLQAAGSSAGLTVGESSSAAVVGLSGQSSSPVAFVKGVYAGSATDVGRLAASGALAEWLKPHDYDLVVIGGGSGGLAAAKEAATAGAKVAVLDFVRPSPQGTAWGLGGTCVNVGCIPKKLFHQAAILGKTLKDYKAFGWDVPDTAAHSWTAMRDSVQGHIAKLNWGYKVELREKSVTYLNAYGTFTGPFSLLCTDKKGKEKTVTADRFLVAVGLRPKYPDVPGAKEHCITSDDLFALKASPGKTLCVGASYISLECGGFLAGFGLDTTVMVRSILLRGFDRDMAQRIGAHMEEVAGVKFIRETVPTKVEQVKAAADGAPGLYKVTAKAADGSEVVGEYNTVVMAIGREARTADLGLDKPGVQLSKSGKLVVEREQSRSAPWVFGIGDVIEGGVELTPVAIQAGRLLARRLFGKAAQHMDYQNIPTTVFTPLEYGCCGLSEEEAVERFGEADVEVFHSLYQPLELTLSQRDQNHAYAKVICRVSDSLRVLGFHLTGPNAGEITQGFGLLLSLGATKAQLDSLVGIHPTQAEVLVGLAATKRNGGELKTSGC